MTFNELDLDPRVLQAVVDTGYTEPTPIQSAAIPPALEGRDVLGIAQTGTGKTASFSLPMISILAKGRARARMPRSLVLCPTRELAAQVAENFEAYSKNVKLTMALLIGGVSFKDQDKKIDRGVDVLIATPGRLLDHFERGKLMLSGIEIMVVDEADRMLDMGFIPDIERIFKLTPFTRQTLFFSATMPPEIQRITNEFLQNPVRVEVARQSMAAETVTQALHMLAPARKDAAPKDKRAKLRDILRSEGASVSNGIIFCNRKRDVDVVHKSLEKHGFDVASLHGDLDQRIRTQVLDAFREGKIRFLVASDVAARGLDIPDVSHVVNFDVPTHPEDYVHRIGRTGRAGRSGKAFTLAVPADDKLIAKIEEMLGREIPRAEGVAAPEATAEKPAAEVAAETVEKPARGRSRRGSRSKRDDPAKAASIEAEAQAPAADISAPVPEAPAPAPAPEAKPKAPAAAERKKAAEAPAPKAARNAEQPRRGRGGRAERDDGRAVRGLGDHVPAFMLIPLPKLPQRVSGTIQDAA